MFCIVDSAVNTFIMLEQCVQEFLALQQELVAAYQKNNEKMQKNDKGRQEALCW